MAQQQSKQELEVLNMYSHSKKKRDFHKAKEYTTVLNKDDKEAIREKPTFIFNKATPVKMVPTESLPLKQEVVKCEPTE